MRVESAFCLRGAGGVPRRAGVYSAHFQSEGGALRPVGCACLYAVEGDLQGLLPYKGDLHMHSYCSDGGKRAPGDGRRLPGKGL